jgi:hypothetical protein
MVNQQNKQTTIKQVREIYVAVFPVPISEDLETETVLAGYLTDPHNPSKYRVRATVETDSGAVPDLVKICDQILKLQTEIKSYRLLKFDQKGVHELDPKDFRAAAQMSFEGFPGASWGEC